MRMAMVCLLFFVSLGGNCWTHSSLQSPLGGFCTSHVGPIKIVLLLGTLHRSRSNTLLSAASVKEIASGTHDPHAKNFTIPNSTTAHASILMLVHVCVCVCEDARVRV